MRRRDELRGYLAGIEHGLQGITLDWTGASKRWVRAYKEGVDRGKAWRAHIRADRFGEPDVPSAQKGGEAGG